MRKIFILVLLALVGISLIFSNLTASETRTITHKFRTFTANTNVGQGGVLYRITGVTTAANGVFGIYNAATSAAGTTSNCAIEGGEGTAGDALPHYYFGADGLVLDTGMSVIISNCYVTIEYI